MKTGVFGGTFNPIHVGHLRAAEEVRERLGLDRVIFVPSGEPPLKSGDLEDKAHRFAMAARAALSNPSFEVSDLEVTGRGKSYTVDTLRTLKAQSPEDSLFFILGVDAFMDIHLWKDPDELVTLADFVVIPRPPMELGEAMMSPYLDIQRPLAGHKEGVLRAALSGGRSVFFIETTNFEVSSTGIRELLGEGRSVKYLLPQEVESYIITNKLYRSVRKAGRRVRA